MKCKKLCAVFVLALGFLGLQAQEVISASGGNASGNGGKVSYTVGQVVYTTNTGTSGSVSQGVQQAYEISVVSGIEQAQDINLICSTYPNPTTNFLTLNVDAERSRSIQSMSYQLFDINGKFLESKILTSNKTTITMENRVASIYFLKVLDNNKELKTFKVIKN
ncbi:MAG: T9SS type A sorting domain-containing protein [Bacteroidetes bacterium]|nr:T9SS type A sorting domain-containing protein [Bacteroidota bacterium]